MFKRTSRPRVAPERASGFAAGAAMRPGPAGATDAGPTSLRSSAFAESTRAPGGAGGSRRVVAAFDFDGTITTRDTLLPFLLRVFGRVRVLRAFSAVWIAGLKRLVGLMTRDAFRRVLIAHLFDGLPVERVKRLGVEHALAVHAWVRPQALARIRWHRRKGHELVLVSAAPDVYLTHVASQLGFDHVLCTRLSTWRVGDIEFYDGGVEGADCTGAEKLRRLRAHVGDLDAVRLHVYGDGAGDPALLSAADHPHHRPFRRREPRRAAR
jgi:phosphatidylglycerophosphatase C